MMGVNFTITGNETDVSAQTLFYQLFKILSKQHEGILGHKQLKENAADQDVSCFDVILT